MKKITERFRVISLMSFICICGLVTSCKKGRPASEYVKGLSDIAVQYNQNCPLVNDNGTTLESVTFAGNIMTYRLSLSDKAIANINLDAVRDSIIFKMSDKLKKYLVKGNCRLKYQYVSPNDSSYITIIPNELVDPSGKEE